MHAPSQYCGGMAVFYRVSLQFTMEAIKKCGPNVVSFQLVTGGQSWYIIVCHLAPEDASTI